MKQDSYILFLDTSKPQARVVLANNQTAVAERSWTADRTLGIRLLQEIEQLLTATGTPWVRIKRIAVHHGPGHYSALRAGIMTASMLAVTHAAELVEITATHPAEQLAQAVTAEPVKIVKTEYKNTLREGKNDDFVILS